MTEFNLITDHSDSTFTTEQGINKRYNETNELFSFGLKSGPWSAGISTFENSYFDRSNMLTVERDLFYLGDFDFSLGVALVTGYKKEIIRDDQFFINDDLLWAPITSLSYNPDWLTHNSLKLAPKIRLMGLDSYMLNLELSYAF